MLQRCVKSAKKRLLFFFEYIILQSHAIMCLHLRDNPDGQAADNEPLSRADKARGISSNKYRLFRAVNPPEKVVNRYADIISDTR